MADDFPDKTQKISRPATPKKTQPKKTIDISRFFTRRRDVDLEISRTRLIRAQKMESPAGDVHADMAEIYPHLPGKEELYESGQLLGEGGQGIVFRAKDKTLERIVAVKSLRKELLDDEQARKSFIAEAKITAQLEHPSVVPIYSLTGDGQNGLHLSMKMLRGMTLATYLDETCQHYREEGICHFDEDKALRYRLELFLRVCDALSYVHSRNLMHRDLKPGNIIIGEYREVYLIDWGIATPIHNEHPGAPVSSLGTPPFMAPEVLNRHPGDQRADIFALGVILFDVVFLKPAFTGDTPQKLIAKVRNGETESFRHAFHAPVSRELVAIVKKAMATSPEARYQSVEELSSDLRNYLANEETKALPDNLFSKIGRAMIKHRKFVAAATSLLLIALLANVAWSLYRQRNAEIAARKAEVDAHQAEIIAHQNEIAQRKLEHVQSLTSKNAAMAAYQIEQKLGNLETLMKEFTAEAAARMDFPPAADAPELVPFIDKENAAQLTDVYKSSYYGCLLRIDHSAYRFAAKNLDQVRAERELAQLAIVMEKLVPRFLHEGSLLPAEKKSLAEIKGEMLQDGNMMLWFYFGTDAGLLLQYPGSDALPDDYDPRDRNWFKQGSKLPHSNVHWSKPYQGLQVKKQMMTCMQACRKNNRLLGVGAFDVVLERFCEIMIEYGNDTDVTDARLLLDETGNVLVSCKGDRKPIWKNSDGKSIHLASTEYGALYRETASRGFGSAVGKVGKGRKLFLLFPIRKMNWYYAEVIDLDKMLAR